MLSSLAPHPALPDHPEFPLMIQVALERFGCTIAELREDYWLGRAWRSLVGDPTLKGRVARVGMADVLVMGPRQGPAPVDGTERMAWRMQVEERIMLDTGHAAADLGITVWFAEEPVDLAYGRFVSLLARAIRGDRRWKDLDRYEDDLSAVLVPVAKVEMKGLPGIAAA